MDFEALVLEDLPEVLNFACDVPVPVIGWEKGWGVGSSSPSSSSGVPSRFSVFGPFLGLWGFVPFPGSVPLAGILLRGVRALGCSPR